jgi:hypothetical protein
MVTKVSVYVLMTAFTWIEQVVGTGMYSRRQEAERESTSLQGL